MRVAASLTEWLSLGGLVAALVALVIVVTATRRKSAELAGAREREHAAQELAHERLHDALTGLPNRALFLDRTGHALARIERIGCPLALLFVDLDQFKRINDSLGHEIGDTLLATLAGRLRDSMRPADTLSRFGGDEFLILCEDLVGQEDALRLASRARDLLELPVLIDGRELQVTCSIGVALRWPGESPIDATTLVRDADAAMYHVKATGRGGVKLFDDELHRSAMQRLDAEGALRTAVMERQLEVHYQPIVALPGEALYGVEALARWNRPGVGPVAAVEFIRLAEECGLIDELGHCVLRTAMNEVARWYELGLIDDDFMLSVNVSARQLANTKLLSIVRRLVESWPLPAGALCLEITESAVGGDPELANRSLDELRSIGVKLALDDFGVGQSSLEQLVHLLPVDILKLDRAFIADLEHPRDRAVVAAVAPMAEDLGMLVVAEGVESAEQAGLLAELGYQLAQGYYFGRPHVGRAFHEWLSATKDVDRVA